MKRAQGNLYERAWRKKAQRAGHARTDGEMSPFLAGSPSEVDGPSPLGDGPSPLGPRPSPLGPLATGAELAKGGKPWAYVLAPDEAVAENRPLRSLEDAYGQA